MEESEPKPTAGQRLGAQESLGVSTLEPGHRPPEMPPGRRVSIRVLMLDDTEGVFEVSQRAPGRLLLDLVCSHLNLIEGDYFGLEFQDRHKMTVWLDLLKPIARQIKRPKQTILRFVVKFFPPDHTQLLEELTRYLFALQIKQDLACGRLICNDSSAALLVSHIIQSEMGDFDEAQSRQYLLNHKYIPNQEGLLDKIVEFHRKHIGQNPAESDFQLLEIARRLEMYGIRLHPAKDKEGTKLSLAVAHTGILVFQGNTKINAFNWSKVRKLSFKRKRFLIKLRPDPSRSTCQDILEFLMGSRNGCKVFWKICVEYHAFFRLLEEPKPKPRPVLFTRGSSFRFSGRTQKQVLEYVKDSDFKKVPFQRKHSKAQSVGRQSPLPPLRSEGPNELSEESDQVDQLGSRPPCSLTDPVDAAGHASNSQREHGSPAQVSGREEREKSAEEVEEGQLTGAPNTGPASLATLGHGFYVPYTDEIDMDSKYVINKGRARSCMHDGYWGTPKSGVGDFNGVYEQRWEPGPWQFKYREALSCCVHPHGMAPNDKLLDGLHYGPWPSSAPTSNALVDELFLTSNRRIPQAAQHMLQSRRPDPGGAAR